MHFCQKFNCPQNIFPEALCNMYVVLTGQTWDMLKFFLAAVVHHSCLVFFLIVATWAVTSTVCKVFSRSFVVILGFLLTSFKIVHCALKVIFVRCPLQSKLFYIGRQIHKQEVQDCFNEWINSFYKFTIWQTHRKSIVEPIGAIVWMVLGLSLLLGNAVLVLQFNSIWSQRLLMINNFMLFTT